MQEFIKWCNEYEGGWNDRQLGHTRTGYLYIQVQPIEWIRKSTLVPIRTADGMTIFCKGRIMNMLGTQLGKTFISCSPVQLTATF